MNRCLWLPLLLSSCAPGWPDGAALTAAKVTGTTVELTWPAASGTDTYRVQQGDKVLAEGLAGNATRFVAGGLDDGQRYAFSVQARAADGGWSTPLRLEVTTPDITPPRWKKPIQFKVAVESETDASARLRLSWGDVEDNLGVHELLILHPPAEPITLPGDKREHAFESAVPDGIWQLEARDRAGNRSAVLGFQVETELTAVRRENRKGRAIGVFAERDRGGSDANLFGPDGPGVAINVPVGRGPGPVWLSEGGDPRGRAWAADKVPSLESCYERAREEDPALAGRLTVTLAVDAAGEVNASRMEGIKSSSLRNCVRDALHGRLPQKPAAAFRANIVVNMSANERKRNP